MSDSPVQCNEISLYWILQSPFSCMVANMFVKTQQDKESHRDSVSASSVTISYLYVQFHCYTVVFLLKTWTTCLESLET